MKITIWHKSGAGTEHTADDFAYIEVDGRTIWNKDAPIKEIKIGRYCIRPHSPNILWLENGNTGEGMGVDLDELWSQF
jgi:hypothetical protein